MVNLFEYTSAYCDVKNLENLKSVKERVGKMVYVNSEEFRRDICISKSISVLNSRCFSLLYPKANEIKAAEDRNKKACLL